MEFVVIRDYIDHRDYCWMRGKRKDNGKWVEGYCAHIEGYGKEEGFYIVFEDDPLLKRAIPLIPGTHCVSGHNLGINYTGVFQTDFCKILNKDIEEEKNLFYATWSSKKRHIVLLVVNGKFFLPEELENKDIKVIGNYFDNPELGERYRSLCKIYSKKNKKENMDKLFRLIRENPNLPVLRCIDYYSVNEEFVRNHMDCYVSIGLGEYISRGERVWFKKDENNKTKEFLDTIKGYLYACELSKKKIQEMYEKIPWVKGIVVNIDIP